MFCLNEVGQKLLRIESLLERNVPSCSPPIQTQIRNSHYGLVILFRTVEGPPPSYTAPAWCHCAKRRPMALRVTRSNVSYERLLGFVTWKERRATRERAKHGAKLTRKQRNLGRIWTF